MKILDGKIALGNKSGTKNLGEHKVGTLSPTSDHYRFICCFKHLCLSIVLEDPARSSDHRFRRSSSY